MLKIENLDYMTEADTINIEGGTAWGTSTFSVPSMPRGWNTNNIRFNPAPGGSPITIGNPGTRSSPIPLGNGRRL
jgi:hypothetical protein